MKQQFRYQTSVKSCRVATEFAAYFKLVLKNSLQFSRHFLFLLYSLPRLFVSFLRSYLSFSFLSFLSLEFLSLSPHFWGHILLTERIQKYVRIFLVRPGKKIPLKKPKCRWYITAKLILKS